MQNYKCTHNSKEFLATMVHAFVLVMILIIHSILLPSNQLQVHEYHYNPGNVQNARECLLKVYRK